MQNQPRTRQLSLFLFGICACVTMLLTQLPLLQADDSKPKTEGAKPSPSSIKVKKSEFNVWLNLEGVYEATEFDEIVLEPKQWKTLKVKKSVSHGSMVMEGDPILWLETEELDKELKKQQRALISAELSLKLASDELRFLKESTAMDLDRSDRTAKNAKNDLEYYLAVTEEQDLKSANIRLKFSKYSLEYAMEELNQLQQMYEADDLTEQTEEIILKRAQRSVESAENALEHAELSHARKLAALLPRTKQSIIDSQAKSALSRAKSVATLPVALRKKELETEALQRSVDELIKNVSELETDSESMTIYADRSGLVYYGRCVNGKWSEIAARTKQLIPNGTVTVNSVLMTIVDPSTLQVRISLTEAQLAIAKKGQRAAFKPNSHTNYFSVGQLSEITSIVQADGKYPAIATTKVDPDVLITPGMTCKIKLHIYENKQALAIPVSMVYREELSDDPRPYVWTGESEKQKQKQFVKTGYTLNGKIEIRSGLNPGDVVWPK